MDTRPDPVQIFAGVRERDGKQRAFDVWVHKTLKAGWSVTVESNCVDEPGTACGVVDVEGLRYRVHHGKRLRLRSGTVTADRHAAAAVADLSRGEAAGISWGWVFTHAAWAEPILTD
jgi:hypothetical protein